MTNNNQDVKPTDMDLIKYYIGQGTKLDDMLISGANVLIEVVRKEAHEKAGGLVEALTWSRNAMKKANEELNNQIMQATIEKAEEELAKWRKEG